MRKVWGARTRLAVGAAVACALVAAGCSSGGSPATGSTPVSGGSTPVSGGTAVFAEAPSAPENWYFVK
jgi:hypothetical protein